MILAQLSGAVAERVSALGADKARAAMIKAPAEFFETDCTSEEDLWVVKHDAQACVNLALQFELIEKIAAGLEAIGPIAPFRLSNTMAQVPIGQAIRMDTFPTRRRSH